MADLKAVPCWDKKDSTSETTAHGSSRAGKVGWIILWLLGVPIPVLLLLFVLRGCT